MNYHRLGLLLKNRVCTAVLEVQSPDQSVSMVCFCWRSSSAWQRPTSHPGRRGKGSLWGLFHGNTSPFHGGSTLMTCSPPKHPVSVPSLCIKDFKIGIWGRQKHSEHRVVSKFHYCKSCCHEHWCMGINFKFLLSVLLRFTHMVILWLTFWDATKCFVYLLFTNRPLLKITH